MADPFTQSLPQGWQFEVPRYRATRDLKPATKNRFRFETPFASLADSSEWQYGERPFEAGEIIESQSWPHPSFFPLNDSARKVLEFFKTRQKSRLPLSPWRGGRIALDEGLTGTGPALPLKTQETAA
jgi:hypothetical protein